MKKVVVCSLIIMLSAVAFLQAEATFYGSARLGMWYERTNKNWNLYQNGVSENNLALNYAMQTNSRFGAKIALKGIDGRVELAISPSKVGLRLLYGKITKGNKSILIGQDYSGFKPYGDQVYADDLNFINYGLFYDGRQPMVKFSCKNKFNAMFIIPKEVDVTGLGGLKSLSPKINVVYECSGDNYYFSTSAGVNINKYNKNFNTDQLDKMILSWAVSLTGKYNLGMINLLAQYCYGVNVGNYGMLTITPSSIVYDSTNKTFENTKTFGGLLVVGCKLFTAGVSYIEICNSLWSDKDTAMSAFIQKKMNICKNVFLVPEVGMIDNMKDMTGSQEGKKIYGGMKIQADF
ncbi:MAG TPA: hypothetical protein ENK03_05090 [Candidatus Cloacimonetes bacterium]|nr:hypothetical protein [Candidatus Cloacimonadota bacterium]